MRYKLEEITDQLGATLRQTPPLNTLPLIATHAGEVNEQTFRDPAMQEGFITLLPFVLIQYQGRTVLKGHRSSAGELYIHRLRFRFFIGAQSLRSKNESAVSCYSILRSLYDAVHGKAPLITAQSSFQWTQLNGTALTSTGASCQQPFLCAEDMDERLVVNLPNIAVYQSDYTVQMLA